MAKIIVSIDATDDKRAAVAKLLADALGVSVGDVVLVPGGCCVSVVEMPAAMRSAHKEEQTARYDASDV